MAERMFGLETEYALCALGPGCGDRAEELPRRLLDVARRTLVCLPDEQSSGVYLQNGSRLYVDVGAHPELATPECTTPWELVRYVRAGEQILLELGRQLEAGLAEPMRLLWLRSNVDYSGSRNTWGCHESYLHQADPSELPEQLIPHLVTRVIYTGAGGFNNLKATPEFLLSPRAAHMRMVVSGGSTDDRGIFHTKDEPLCQGDYHRLHVLFGESLCSDLALWLKVGATALVVAMAEAGLHPGKEVRLKAPLEAMHAVARDVCCRAALELANGRRATALEIQRHYLGMAESSLDHPLMPPWAGDVCRLWRLTLERLEAAPDGVSGMLDWAIKWTLYQRRLHANGFSLEKLEALASLFSNPADREEVGWMANDDPDLLISPTNPLLERAAALTPRLRAMGLRWQDLKQLRHTSLELFELDTRFGQLGEGGVFTQLDSQGLLAHRVPGVEPIAPAIVQPPGRGRARLRGEAIRKQASEGRKGTARWTRVVDTTFRRVLDLSDPFCEQERWRRSPVADEDDDVEALLARLLEELVRRSEERR